MLNETRRADVIEKIQIVNLVEREFIWFDGIIDSVGKEERWKRGAGQVKVRGKCSERAIGAGIVIQHCRFLHQIHVPPEH